MSLLRRNPDAARQAWVRDGITQLERHANTANGHTQPPRPRPHDRGLAERLLIVFGPAAAVVVAALLAGWWGVLAALTGCLACAAADLRRTAQRGEG